MSSSPWQVTDRIQNDFENMCTLKTWREQWNNSSLAKFASAFLPMQLWSFLEAKTNRCVFFKGINCYRVQRKWILAFLPWSYVTPFLHSQSKSWTSLRQHSILMKIIQNKLSAFCSFKDFGYKNMKFRYF